MRWRVWGLLGLTIMCMALQGCAPVSAATESEALNAVAVAQTRVLAGYKAFREAEAVGANISTLAVRLEGAGELLSRAELAYRHESFNSTVLLAGACTDELAGFVVEAQALAEAAVQRQYFSFMWTVGGSVVATAIVVVGSVAVWYWFKKRMTGGGVV